MVIKFLSRGSFIMKLNEKKNDGQRTQQVRTMWIVMKNLLRISWESQPSTGRWRFTSFNTITLPAQPLPHFEQNCKYH